ncbi:hypothetical protein DFS34DRAFT_673816 [Phlyctochytrium arcticum]|nr:hypothetical protein DFS34DRAFT_673816 [Phlyctochytrium arcticum]
MLLPLLFAHRIIVAGFMLQAGNVVYGFRHTRRRPTVYNISLFICLVIYALSFVPLMMSTAPAIGLQDETQITALEDVRYVAILKRVWTAAYSIATLMYLILVQIRFRVVKSLHQYNKLYDTAFLVVTGLAWLLSVLWGVVIVDDNNATLQALSTAAWTLYALLIDHSLSFAFIYQLYKSRRAAGGAKKKKWKEVVYSLIFICVVTWLCLVLLSISTLAFPHDSAVRTFVFRLGYAFTPLEFSGALVFIYNAKELVSAPTAAENQRQIEQAIKNVKLQDKAQASAGLTPLRTPSSKNIRAMEESLSPTSGTGTHLATTSGIGSSISGSSQCFLITDRNSAHE